MSADSRYLAAAEEGHEPPSAAVQPGLGPEVGVSAPTKSAGAATPGPNEDPAGVATKRRRRPLTLARVFRRLGWALLVVIGAATVVFFITHVIGDPVKLMLPLDATQEQIDAFRANLGLDQPLVVQYLNYLADLARGDFGTSYWQSKPALNLALSRLLLTLALASVAVFVSSVAGILFGFLAAIREGSLFDRAVNYVSTVAMSIANFWLALMLILIFAVELQWFPTSGVGLRNLVLPVLAASAAPLGRITQIARSSMLEQLRQPYLLVARARGLSVNAAVAAHAARNAFIPVLSMIGFELGAMIGGDLIVIESIFNWPGLGNLTYQSLIHRDFPLIQACVIVIAVVVVVTNLLVDALYGVIDPRVRS